MTQYAEPDEKTGMQAYIDEKPLIVSLTDEELTHVSTVFLYVLMRHVESYNKRKGEYEKEKKKAKTKKGAVGSS